MNDIAVIGGGAAGLAAALCAAEQGCTVALYESSDRVGRSILATGNGRCNFSNAHIDVASYHNASFVQEVFAAATAISGDVFADVDDSLNAAVMVWDFFERHGLFWRVESDGRMYPASLKASSVLDVLRYSALAAGVQFCCETPLANVEPPWAPGKPFTMRTRDGEFKRAQRVIVAVGGAVGRTLLPDDVPFEEQRPVLGPLATDTDAIRGLDNTRVRVIATLRDSRGALKASESGEMLFRKYGVSGIAVFNLSRMAQPGDILSIDLLFGLGEAGGAALDDAEARERFECEQRQRSEAARQLFAQRYSQLARVFPCMTAEEFFRGLFTANVAEALCRYAHVPYEAPLVSTRVSELADAASSFTLTVRGIGDERQCQVRRGGVSVDAVDPRTMELRAHPGLHVIGEALDVDGPCGGYNLHWAWISGLLAGKGAADCFLR